MAFYSQKVDTVSRIPLSVIRIVHFGLKTHHICDDQVSDRKIFYATVQNGFFMQYKLFQ